MGWSRADRAADSGFGSSAGAWIWARRKRMAAENCDTCVNFVYDEEEECYYCLVDLDEDEMYRFLSGNQRECPYYRLDDEYGVVRHQL